MKGIGEELTNCRMPISVDLAADKFAIHARGSNDSASHRGSHSDESDELEDEHDGKDFGRVG